MSKFRVRPMDDRTWAVTMMNDQTGEREIVRHGLATLEVAKYHAAVMTWAAHLDAWMTSLVEDEDVVEEIAEILGLMSDLSSEMGDAEFEKGYDKAIEAAVGLLPAGLRQLAEQYDKEWRERHSTTPQPV